MLNKIIQFFSILCLTFLPVHANVDVLKGVWTVTVKKGDIELFRGDKECKLYISEDKNRFTFRGIYKGDYSRSGTLIEEQKK